MGGDNLDFQFHKLAFFLHSLLQAHIYLIILQLTGELNK